MDKVVMVHFLGVDDVTVLFLAQFCWVDAIGSQEFSVGHAKGLTNGLCDELCLGEGGEERHETKTAGKTRSREGETQSQRLMLTSSDSNT